MYVFRLNQLVVQNKTKHPVPDLIKEGLVQNNPERGIKFTLSHLMNDQMLLGNIIMFSLCHFYLFCSDNFLLKKKKGPLDRKKGLTINWKCVTQNCYFCATTVDFYLEHSNGVHNHESNVEAYHKREGRIKLKRAAIGSDAPLASVIIQSCMIYVILCIFS